MAHSTRRALWAGMVGVAVSSSILACHGESPPGSPGDRNKVEKGCRVLESGQWAFPPAPASKPPESRVALWAFATETWLNEQLDRQQPKRLAKESGRSIGAPGRASYEVRRGRLRFSQSKDQVRLSLPVSADISVCKPIGRGCLRYGQCEPRFRVDARLDAALSEDYGWAAPRLSISTEKKCVIGLDVTPRLEEIAEGELRAVRRQLRSRWPDTRAWAERGLLALARPAALGDGSCTRWVEPRLRQRRLQVREVLDKSDRSNQMRAVRELEWGWELSGTLLPLPPLSPKDTTAPTTECASGNAPLELPDLESAAHLPRGSRFWLPARFDLAELKAQAAHMLPRGDQVAILELRTFEGGLAARVRLAGAFCGTLWVQGKLVAQDANLRWDSLTPSASSLPNSLTEAERKHLGEVLDDVAAQVAWPLSLDAWARSSAARRWVDARLEPLRRESEAWGGQIRIVEWKVGRARVDVNPDDITVSTPIGAHLSIERAGNSAASAN